MRTAAPGRRRVHPTGRPVRRSGCRCSEFGEVITAIDALDADVTTIEASRSKMEVLDDLAAIGYSRGVGPGVWDIHSPRVPSHDEVVEALRRAVTAVPAHRLWVNRYLSVSKRDS